VDALRASTSPLPSTKSDVVISSEVEKPKPEIPSNYSALST
jgi:hypothetical protein